MAPRVSKSKDKRYVSNPGNTVLPFGQGPVPPSLPASSLLGREIYGPAIQANNNNGMGSTPNDRCCINLAQATTMAQAAACKAYDLSVPMNIAIVDPAGSLVHFIRMDNAMPGSIEIAIKKARTVALFNGTMTTESMQNMCLPGGNVYGFEQTNGGLVVFGGGLPVKEKHNNAPFIGAIGVSGGSARQDIAVAQAMVDACPSPQP